MLPVGRSPSMRSTEAKVVEITGTTRNNCRTHSHEPPETRSDYVRRSGAVAMPPFAGGRRAQRARRAGRRDFIGEQLPDAQAHTVRAGGGRANYLSLRASYIAVSLGRARGAVERPTGRRHTSNVPMGCARPPT